MDVMQWHHDALAARTLDALKRNDFDAVYFPVKEQAVEYVLGFVRKGSSVGFGGSVTSASLGLPALAEGKGAVVLDHTRPGLTEDEKLDVRRKQLVCDLFISSVNALTLDGCILNVDGVGNRVSAITFGPRKVILIAGTNKIRKNLDEALERIRHYAAPMNNKRLGMQNPCTVSGTCSECEAKTRICRIYSTLRRKPVATDITVVIVGTGLGY